MDIRHQLPVQHALTRHLGVRPDDESFSICQAKLKALVDTTHALKRLVGSLFACEGKTADFIYFNWMIALPVRLVLTLRGVDLWRFCL